MLTRNKIIAALTHLGKLAQQKGQTIELLVVGGVALMLAGQQRLSTHDVDAIILAPYPAKWVRALVSQVANELALDDDWLNDGAKGFLVGQTEPTMLFEAPGIVVLSPSTAQLLAMKLSAWRDIRDAKDAQYLLSRLTIEIDDVSLEQIWTFILPHLIPGRELKARYAFLEIFNDLFGDQDATV